MAEALLVNGFKNTAPDTIEKLYTSPASGGGGLGTLITAFTASNNSTSSVSYKAYIYDAAETLVDAVVPQTIVVRDRFSLGPSAVGQLIPAGGSLRTESSTANALAFTVTGDEL